jgi:3-oxoacyl-[acyl-carrier protein] reductase
MSEILKNKIAVITGGARGIGRAIATEFLNEGAVVIVLDKFYPDDFTPYTEELTQRGMKITSRTLDITDTKSTEQLFEEIAKEFGRIDILVNNAGVTRDKLLIRMTEEDWDAVLSVNLKGAFNTTRVVSKIMARQRYGKIVNISSIVGIRGNAGQANYAASKAGLIGLSKSIAKELAGRNVCVNCVAPGYVETDMTAQLTQEQKDAFLNEIPMKRGSKPEEIAGVVTFLASDRSDYITGQVLAVDGGISM